MNALSGQESGGNSSAVNADTGAYGTFQIMPENWASWAAEAGLSPNSPMTAENQNLVAKVHISNLYNALGNWADVAKTWYSGYSWQGMSDSQQNIPFNGSGYLDANGQYPSINSYANSILSKMTNASTIPVATSSHTNGGFMSSITNSLWRVVNVIVGIVLVIGGLFLLFKDNTMVLEKEGGK